MKEKKPMKKGVKIFLGVLVGVLVVGLCMGAVGLYLMHENNKPVFEFPQIEERSPLSALPADGVQAAAYVERLFAAATAADDVEGSWHTDVRISDVTSSLAPADNDLLQYIAERATGELGAIYPAASEQVMASAQDVPVFALSGASVTDFSASQGERNEEEDEDDTASYYLEFTCAPAAVDVGSVQTSDVYLRIAEKLSPALRIEAFSMTTQGERVSAHTDCLSDDLLELTVTKNYTIQAIVHFAEDYAALSESGTAEVEFAYETVQHFTFSHYGLRFLKQQMAVREDDLQALPIRVTVHSTATKEDYRLTFDISDPQVLSVDDTGVVDVHATNEEAVTITATLEYDGHIYTDTITVYVTELEVKKDV